MMPIGIGAALKSLLDELTDVRLAADRMCCTIQYLIQLLAKEASGDDRLRQFYTDHKAAKTSSHARQLREKLLKANDHMCEYCGIRGPKLALHHVSNKNRGYEGREDVALLCARCHGGQHRRGPRAKRTKATALADLQRECRNVVDCMRYIKNGEIEWAEWERLCTGLLVFDPPDFLIGAKLLFQKQA